MPESLQSHHVLQAYVNQPVLSNKELYAQLELAFGEKAASAQAPIGKSQVVRNVFHRAARWHQQSLRHLGMLEPAGRAQWRLTEKASKELTPAPRKSVMVAFSTDLGCALWANAADVFTGLQDEIALCFTSPPYPLARERAYGNTPETHYVAWLVNELKPIVKALKPGGHVVLNLSNDIFESGLPSRSLYLERLTLALHDTLGLHLMDRLIWENPSKPPGPFQWSSRTRQQLNVGYEPVLWFTNDPARCASNNRRVLQPHTPAHLQLVRQGGEQREAVYSGGAYRVKHGSFGQETTGKIPRNVLRIAHRDADQQPARDYATERGWSAHPAPMPVKLARFFVDFLTEVKELVVDPFGGMATTAKAAECGGRRWLVTERCREYIESASQRFVSCPGFAF